VSGCGKRLGGSCVRQRERFSETRGMIQTSFILQAGFKYNSRELKLVAFSES
jgi:hypothetical protein